MSIKAYMVCHTHWDREWYLTKNQFKTKMVRLVDSVLDTIENNPSLSFMLDGQTIVLEDYMSIRPENRGRLINAIAENRLCVGPWYILPDEFLVSGESHIRNYLIGQKVASQFGAKMNVAYLPDSFGHPEQMPQIISGLTMSAALFWRGVPGTVNDSEFYWQSAEPGTSVLAVNMPYGYGNSARLSTDPAITVPRLKAMMNQLNQRTRGDLVLLMNGSDHILNQPEISDIVQSFNQLSAPEYEIKISTMESFLEDLRPTLKDLGSYKGELRSGDRSMLLAGTISTRSYLKQWNTRVESQMERYLEPSVALQMLIGQKPHFAGYQDYLWKKILENQPHDSICGCSVDAVHKEMMTRYHCVDELETTLLTDCMQNLGKQQSADETDGIQMLYFEPTQDSLPCCKEVTVDFDPVLVQRVNFAKSTIDEYEQEIHHPNAPENVAVTDHLGRNIPAQILSSEKAYYNHLQDETAPEVYKVNRCRIALQLPPFPYGLSVLNFRRAPKDPSLTAEKSPYIENEFFRVSPDGEGSFCVTNKKSGKIWRGVGKLIDKGDAGDEYTYSWPEHDTICTLSGVPMESSVEVIPNIWQKLHAKAVFTLPASLNSDRKSRSIHTVSCPVCITVTLFQGQECVDFTVDFENNAMDHILQIEFPSAIRASVSCASSAFSVTRRNIEFQVPDEWMERPLPTYPTHGFVDVSNKTNGLTVVCDGLNEFEAVNEGNESKLRVTLLRCVGWLSRADLLTRVGNGGWCYETPDAQCLGKHRFHCAAIYHEKGWQDAGTLAQADRILHPPLISPVFGNSHGLSPENPLKCLSSLPREVRLSACKPAEDGLGIVVRVYSVASEKKTVDFSLPESVECVYSCTLAETQRKPLEISNHKIKFDIKPGQIRSFYWQLKTSE